MLAELIKVVRASGQSLRGIALAVVLSVASSFFEIVSIFLLVPIIQVLMGGELTQGSSFSLFGWTFRVKDLIEAGQTRKDLFALLIIVFAIASLGRPLSVYYSNIVLGRFVSGFVHGIRSKIFRNYMAYGKRYFDEGGSGDLSANILHISGALGGSLGQCKDSISSILLGVGYVFVMLQVSWKLSVICLVFVPIIGLLQKELSKRIGRAAQEGVGKIGVLTQKVTDVLRCMVFVKSANQSEQENARFIEISREFSALEYGIGKKHGLNGLLSEVATIIIGLFLIASASILFQRRGSDFGPQFIVFFLAFRRFFSSLSSLGNIRALGHGMSGLVTKLLDVLAFKPEYVVPDGKLTFPKKLEKIEVRNLELKYGERLALNGVNMLIQAGQVTGIVGPSGSGKSSLLTLFNRFYEFDGGDILINGVSIRDYSIASLRENCGYISQETHVFNESLRYNLQYGCHPGLSDEQLIAALYKATLGPLYGKLPKGLESRLGDNGVLLSGGERQRLAIARTLLRNPPLLILDEATSALDEGTEREVQSALEELCIGRTTIVVAHRLTTIAKAPVVYTMENGRVTAQQTGEEVVRGLKPFRILKAM